MPPKNALILLKNYYISQIVVGFILQARRCHSWLRSCLEAGPPDGNCACQLGSYLYDQDGQLLQVWTDDRYRSVDHFFWICHPLVNLSILVKWVLRLQQLLNPQRKAWSLLVSYLWYRYIHVVFFTSSLCPSWPGPSRDFPQPWKLTPPTWRRTSVGPRLTPRCMMWVNG